MCLAVMLHEVACYSIDLHGQLPCGRDDDGAGAIPGHKLGSMQQLQAGYQKCQCLS